MSDQAKPGTSMAGVGMSGQAKPGTSMAGVGQSGRDVGPQAWALVNSVVKLARQLGETSAADLLVGQATAADTTARIVVAGEAKQGKSSLINCLIGVEDLSPVDADIATAVPLKIGYGPEIAVRLNLTSGDQLTVTPAELPGWVSMVEAELDQLRQVNTVEIYVPSALLEPGIVLVDTPGVGGLVAGHAKMTLRSLETATAMLFVTDADTKLTQPELEFLARASERIAAVVFVITKIDATPDWKRVRDENREVLARYAPRYADAPMLGVSARLATRARALAETDRQLYVNLFAESGLGQLQSLIGRRIRPVATTLALANTVALSRSTLERLTLTVKRNLAATTGDSAVTAAFEAEKARVAELRREQLTWGTTLERSLFNARTSLRESVKSATEELRVSGAELAKSLKGRDTSQLVAQLDANLDALAQDMSVALNTAVVEVCNDMLTSLNIASPLELSAARSGEVNVRQFDPNANIALNLLNSGMTAFMGFSASSTLVGAGIAANLLNPFFIAALPLVGAAGLAYAMHHVRGAAARRVELGAWVRAETDRAAGERYADIERGLTTAKLDITDVVRVGLIEREREVAAALEEAKAARAQSQKELSDRQQAHRSAIATATKLAATADELLRVLLTAAALTAPNAAGHRSSVTGS